MENPRVTILMSVYNGKKHLREAVDSILNQTFGDYEFIIVDDGSTDETPAALNEYRRKDQRIRIITNDKNLGLTRALNTALREARGVYIARMDADDIALPERIERQVDFMDKHSEVVLLGTAFLEIDEFGALLTSKTFPSADKELRKLLIRLNPFCHASVVIRRSALDKTGLYDETIPKTQDYDLWFRLAHIGGIANLPDHLIMRRYEKGNISISQENEQLKWAIRIRMAAVKKYYSPAAYIHLIRPLCALMTPFFIRKLIRKYFLGNRMYG